MTQKYTHDVETDEVVVENLTADEVKELKAREKEYKERTLALEAEAEAKAVAKAAILSRIGLTADELKTILG